MKKDAFISEGVFLGLVVIIKVVRRIDWIAGDIDTQLAEAVFVVTAEDGGGMSLAAIELAQLLHAHLRSRIGSSADGQRDEDLFAVESWVLIAQGL